MFVTEAEKTTFDPAEAVVGEMEPAVRLACEGVMTVHTLAEHWRPPSLGHASTGVGAEVAEQEPSHWTEPAFEAPQALAGEEQE